MSEARIDWGKVRNATWAFVGGALGCLVAASAALAVQPAHVGGTPGLGGPTGALVPAPQPGSVVVCDQMAMVRGGTYTTGNGNAIGGSGVFGGTSDLQIADDCVHGLELEITQVCQGSLTFFGAPPANGLWVQVYADVAGSPANTASFEQVTTAVTVTPFTDTVFGLLGEVLCADLAPGFVMPAGTWWWNIQPVSVAGGDDWYYQVRRTNVPPTGGDSHGKGGATEHGGAFGGPYPGGYGTDVWLPMTSLGFLPGDAAFSIMGQPSSLTADLTVSKDDGQTTAGPGDTLTYAIVVSNLGPDDAPGTLVTDLFPAGLTGVTWTCAPTAGSICTPAGVGDLADLADILASGSVAYTATGTVAAGVSGELSNTAQVIAGPNVDDPDPANDAATDVTTVTQSVLEVPTLDAVGLGLLALVLAAAALLLLRRRSVV